MEIRGERHDTGAEVVDPGRHARDALGVAHQLLVGAQLGEVHASDHEIAPHPRDEALDAPIATVLAAHREVGRADGRLLGRELARLAPEPLANAFAVNAVGVEALEKNGLIGNVVVRVAEDAGEGAIHPVDASGSFVADVHRQRRGLEDRPEALLAVPPPLLLGDTILIGVDGLHDECEHPRDLAEEQHEVRLEEAGLAGIEHDRTDRDVVDDDREGECGRELMRPGEFMPGCRAGIPREVVDDRRRSVTDRLRDRPLARG